MRALKRAMEGSSRPIAVPWDALAVKLDRVPRSTLVIIGGAPGAGKSIFTLAWGLAINGNLEVINLDTDSRTQAARVLGNITGKSYVQILKDLEDPFLREYWIGQMESLEAYKRVHVTDRALTPEDVKQLLRADKDWWGSFPDMTIIDDMSKMDLGLAGYQEYQRGYIKLREIAQRSHTTMFSIHHLKQGPSQDPRRHPRFQDFEYKPGYEAEVVLGISRPKPSRMHVSILKNRFGESDADGNLYVELACDMDRVSITDPPIDFFSDMLEPEESLWTA